MNIEYENVPNIISGKDLDYLSDMFSWSYNAYKFTLNALNNKEEDVTNMLKKASDEFYNILTRILSILNNGGSNE